MPPVRALERQTAVGRTLVQTFASQGTLNGKVINSGDTVTWWQRVFVGGHFEGQDVIATLKGYHDRLAELISTAE